MILRASATQGQVRDQAARHATGGRGAALARSLLSGSAGLVDSVPMMTGNGERLSEAVDESPCDAGFCGIAR